MAFGSGRVAPRMRQGIALLLLGHLACGGRAQVQGLRIGNTPERIRVVLDLAFPLPYKVERQGQALQATLEGTCAASLPALTETKDPILPRIEVLSRQPQTVLRLRVRGLPPFHAFALNQPPRLVIDVQKVYEEMAEESVAEGVSWHRRIQGTPEGFRAVNLLRIRWQEPHLEVVPALAGDTLLERNTVRSIADREGALAAINGGFFAREGPPLGWLVIGGEWVKLPPWPRTALVWWPKEGRYAMELVQTLGMVQFQRGAQLEVFSLNGTPQAGDDLALFTPRWGEKTPGLPDFMGLAVEEERIVEASAWGQAVRIPPSGFALLLNRRTLPRLESDIRLGDRVSLRWSTRPEWDSIAHALGAGPRLVRQGKPFLTAEIERFQKDVAQGRTARAAVGFTQRQEMLWATVDGYGPLGGMTLEEWARWLLAQGAWDAMNLDGGASTSLVVKGELKNFPLDGVERRVSNALLLRLIQSPGKEETQ